MLRQAHIALALMAFVVMAAARAEDSSPPQPPAATLSGQKSGGPGGRAATPPAAEQHRLPPDSTTKQTLELPGRTLAFTATAGSIRLFDGKGEPQADIAYTAYQLDGADARIRRSAAMLRFPRPRPISSPTPRPGSSLRISSSSIPWIPAIAVSSRQAMTCARGFSRSTATSTQSR
jgi:hypothetical protein